MKTYTTSSNGTVTLTATGLIHTADRTYTGALAEEGVEATVYDAPKRGRGRPRKDAGKYDFSEFGTSAFGPTVVVPKWNGPVRVYNKLGDE